MPSRKKTPTEHIPVVDQVGKRHMVVKYVGPSEASVVDRPDPEVEYRLANGHSVQRVGDDAFQSADGRLLLKAV
jgi:hypothetical protein